MPYRKLGEPFRLLGTMLGKGLGGGGGDTEAPTVVITSSESSPTVANPIPITITFSEEVTGFVVGDITVGNGAAGNFATADNIVFTADITPTDLGTSVTVDITAGVCEDLAGNPNTAASQFEIYYEYAYALVNEYGADEVWPLVDIASGTTITAKVTSARNGTLSGWDLQNTAGPRTGTLAPLSGGVDYGNILTASLNGIFNGDVGSMFCWGKVVNWSPAAAGYFITLYVDGNNLVLLYQSSVANRLTLIRKASGSQQVKNADSQSHSGWFSIAATWDTGAGVDGELKLFVNGSQVGSTTNTLPSFASNTLTRAVIGNNNVLGASSALEGWPAFCAVKFGAAWTPTQISEMHAAINP